MEALLQPPSGESSILREGHLGEQCQCMKSMGEFCMTAHFTSKKQPFVVKLARQLLSDQQCCGHLTAFCRPQGTDPNLLAYFRTDYMVNRLLLCTAWPSRQDNALSCRRFQHPGHQHILRYVDCHLPQACIASESYTHSLFCVMRQPYFRATCEAAWINLLQQALLGLRYMHCVACAYHRNLHPQALVCEQTGSHPKEWQWRIADFGSCALHPRARMEHYCLDVVIMAQWLLQERLFECDAHTTLPDYTVCLQRFAGVTSFTRWGKERLTRVTEQIQRLVRGLEAVALRDMGKEETLKMVQLENLLLHETQQHHLPHRVAERLKPMYL